MRNPKRLALFGLLLGGIVFLGLLFAPFVMQYLISPLALFAWLILRLFVLSIDQIYYWWLLIALASFWVARHFINTAPEIVEPPAAVTNAALKSIDNWRYLIHVSTTYISLRSGLKTELRQMLLTLHASRRGSAASAVPFSSAYGDVFEPLQKRQIPLPEPVHAFLFEPEPEEVQLTFWQKLRALPRAPGEWLRRQYYSWSGQEAAQYHQSIEAVLNYMESMLEVPDDDKPG